MEAWDKIDDVREDGAHDKRIRCTGNDVGKLDVELAVVPNRPPSDSGASVRVEGSSIDAIQSNNIVNTEEGVEHQPNHTGNAVLGEHVHRVVDSDPIFDWDLCQSLRLPK